MTLRGCLTFCRDYGSFARAGPEGAPRERRASGVSCRARTHQWPKRTREVAFAHPTDAMGTKRGFGGKIASIESSFVFQLAEYPHVGESQNLVGQNMQLRDLAP